ncbi:conserved hypothetical protein [Lodderomyces elongisporus NRRL YB-4239]|uniref:Actin-related protein 4 n=1 Tax=Lodderomyces elongisporus (strain ATCC 11503 / CBS 2605 / JCM 1781 / NBRC 1676 / NRRL YB-4239) TaxID=379508 RepID=A5E5Q2_LODEL|nr:conserved hypothetical protein [Lodderomyces elongisporus NRRL YB-4239]
MSSANANTVYGGDEINAIILDIGTHTTRIGYAGDDFPKIITTSNYGKTSQGTKVYGENIDVLRSGGTTVHPIVTNSLITDWDAAMDQFAYYFKLLKIEQNDQPIMITEPIWSTYEYRKTLVEKIYAKFDFPALYLIKVPSCISFQQGRPNCLVVDVGYESASVTPVVDGICLIKSSVRTPYAGKFLDNVVSDSIKNLKSKSDDSAKKINDDGDDDVDVEKNQATNDEKNGENEGRDNAKEVKKPTSIAIEPAILIKSKDATSFPQEAARYELKSFAEGVTITDSFRKYEEDKIWHEFKESMLEVPTQENIKHLQQQQQQQQQQTLLLLLLLLLQAGSDSKDIALHVSEFSQRLFELPTGQSITMGQERFTIAETIFDPKSYTFNDTELTPPSSNGDIPGIEQNTINDYRPVKRIRRNEDEDNGDSANGNKQADVRGLVELVSYVINNIDIDLRAGLANNIIITGGTSLVTQLTERLYHELTLKNPGLKIRLHAVGNSTERINQSWIGASVLASLGTFHQMWVSKKEWEDEGSERILNQRFR